MKLEQTLSPNKILSKSEKRQLIGTVVSARETNTVRVLVHTIKMDPKYRKQYKTSAKYAADNTKGMSKLGDSVLVEECRPISKTKRWRVVKVL